MTDVIRVIVRDPEIVRAAGAQEAVTVAQQVLPGPPGPRGAPGIGSVSLDAGNAIGIGSDGGLYCPAIVASTLHW